jgi:hypothetical protein
MMIVLTICAVALGDLPNINVTPEVGSYCLEEYLYGKLVFNDVGYSDAQMLANGSTVRSRAFTRPGNRREKHPPPG